MHAQGVSHRHLSDHLSDLVEQTLSDLEASKVMPGLPAGSRMPPVGRDQPGPCMGASVLAYESMAPVNYSTMVA